MTSPIINIITGTSYIHLIYYFALCLLLSSSFRHRRHQRRLAWIIRDHSSDEQPSSLSDRITYPFPASSDGIQTSCWNDIGIAGFQTVLNRQAHFMRYIICQFNNDETLLAFPFFLRVICGYIGGWYGWWFWRPVSLWCFYRLTTVYITTWFVNIPSIIIQLTIWLLCRLDRFQLLYDSLEMIRLCFRPSHSVLIATPCE